MFLLKKSEIRNKIALSWNDDKRMKSIDSIEADYMKRPTI